MASSNSAIHIHDPLETNLRRQVHALLASTSPTTPNFLELTALASLDDGDQILATLSRLLCVPALTTAISTTFRPLLFDLCARWILEDGDCHEQLAALCFLIEPHEQLFPILHRLLQKPVFQDGILGTLPLDIGVVQLHRLLFAYYRILQANRELPQLLFWPLAPLSQVIWDPKFDPGSRLLAIKCYAMQSGMGEEEREKLEVEILGEPCGIDCPLWNGQSIEGAERTIDGWLMPLLELQRITDARNEIGSDRNDYFTNDEPRLSFTLCSLTANICGILLLRSSNTSISPSPLVATATTTDALRRLSVHFSLRLPTLITSPPSSGKSILISHLASVLFPAVPNQIVTIHLADTSLDPRSLLGSYVSSATDPGTFEWKEGVLVRAMRHGKWVVLQDIDKGSNEVLGILKPLVESLKPSKWVGGRASIDIAGRGRLVADHNFALFATRSIIPTRDGSVLKPTFFGAHKFFEVALSAPSPDEVFSIISSRYSKLSEAVVRATIHLWDAIRRMGTTASVRPVGIRELEKFCSRIENVLPSSCHYMDITISDDDNKTVIGFTSIFPNSSLREDIFLEARDVFFGAGVLTAAARAHSDAITTCIAEHLGLEPDRRDWVLQGRTPHFGIEKDANGIILSVHAGRTSLPAKVIKMSISEPKSRPFAMHRPAVLLLSRIATAVSLAEPLLLTGETGTGKTSVITHLSFLLRRTLTSLNLSHQTESSDLIGGFKPIDIRMPASELQTEFLDLFQGTFSRKKNVRFEGEVLKSVQDARWKRAVALWRESIKLAKDRIVNRSKEESTTEPERGMETDTPRKRRKVDHGSLNKLTSSWLAFERKVDEFEACHMQGKGKFAFAFIEGPLVKAIRRGDWVLLDEINLASPETLECISGLLSSSSSSITLTEQGSLEPIPRHPDFRLFACMNPATDVGKKDLPPNVRSRFTEIDVPPPDADKETLLSIITQYLGATAQGDKASIMNVAEFYTAVKHLSETRQIADGSNHRPHYSMRTLARSLTFAVDIASSYGLRRAIWEGCLMAFTMVLDKPSAEVVTALAYKHLMAGVRNPKSILMKDPTPPRSNAGQEYVKLGPFYLAKGPLPTDPAEDYILTPSVEAKLIDLARIILTKRFPVLIEGPTSSGKTSSVEYLARRTGHRFVRINNHEHTDIQEYIGSYVSDPKTGKLVYKDGLLVRALRNGEWIVLDELNLAPTDVLEALNRLLDDNRELLIPETQEVIKPHPSFMLFATQNPPGLYAGRKVLSRAFRNRFLEVHFDDVPQSELETILCQRCQIAPSYATRIVSVFQELQKRRQLGRVFESKHGYATLRDLFRWAGRDAISVQELAENGYMLLAERARRQDDRKVVKEVIESTLKVHIDELALYNLHGRSSDPVAFLGCPLPSTSQLIWTFAMQRLFILVSRALRFNEPVLLVGETGCGKTSVCQVYAESLCKDLYTVNCHQNTETADLIGGLRPVRNRTHDDPLFEWRDGPLVEAMRSGDIFLLDEISLADDSVLERLNSVLEPTRTIVLAERGGEDLASSFLQAQKDFKLVATMNPGGDYGKKELSPALRNRFTEIWVPSVDDRADLELIVGNSWKHDQLRQYTGSVLDFSEWLSGAVGDTSIYSLRDIIAWVTFSNTVVLSDSLKSMSGDDVFHHAANMTFLDGLSSLPQLNAYSRDAIEQLRTQALSKLRDLAPSFTQAPTEHNFVYDPSSFLQVGLFAIPRGPLGTSIEGFNLQAPTTEDNAMRVVRACQLAKPILLEGSPGVGKTSLITALAKLSGHRLCRINLSDQTDLMDLFGSDLPVEGGGPGALEWKDAEFLRALQEGHWVLLDEMNLAPQSVLEGLNAVLDHRGTVYVPELGRSFVRHPSFRIFAAQNPLHQGGGRKGLPKSFVNRFTKVYVKELSSADLLLVCRSAYPSLDAGMLQAMITFNMLLNDEVCLKKMYGREGTPWEFNLRDILRWAALITRTGPGTRPEAYFYAIYLHRFRNQDDRTRVQMLFDSVFGKTEPWTHTTYPSISPTFLRFGRFTSRRKGYHSNIRSSPVLQSHLPALESAGLCVVHSWLSVITGPHDSGKTELVRTLANLSGVHLQEISVNSATDTMDILGSFEQVNDGDRAASVIQGILNMTEEYQRTIPGSKSLSRLVCKLSQALATSALSPTVLADATAVLDSLSSATGHLQDRKQDLRASLASIQASSPRSGCFQWKDGPLVQAMRDGHWLLLDGANLCNPAVLDRMNSLCEPDGVLTLSERGHVHGTVVIVRPHPDFRLFMCVDPQYGELSRAMRNRGLEISLNVQSRVEDIYRRQIHLRLPKQGSSLFVHDVCRRGLQNQYHTQLVHDSILMDVNTSQHSALTSISHAEALYSAFQDQSHPTGAYLNVYARVAAPLYRPYFTRLLSMRRQGVARNENLSNLIRLMTSSTLDRTVADLRQRHCQTWGVPLSFLCAQPFDFYLTCPPCEDCDFKPNSVSPHQMLFQTLELYVATMAEHDPRERSGNQSKWLAKMSDVDQRIFCEIINVIEGTRTTARGILENIPSSDDSLADFTEINLSIQLLQFSSFLRGALGSTVIDISTAQVVSGWMVQALKHCPFRFTSVRNQVQSLQALVSLSSGRRLMIIWEAFLQYKAPDISFIDIRRLDHVASHLLDKAHVLDLRHKTLRLLSLQMLQAPATDDQVQVLRALFHELEPRLAVISTEAENGLDLSTGLLDLQVLSRVCVTASCEVDSEHTVLIENAVALACQDRTRSLLPAVALQHLEWTMSAGGSIRKTLFIAHLRWLEDLWMNPAIGKLYNGPVAALIPTNLRTVTSICGSQRHSLEQFKEFETGIGTLVQICLLGSNAKTTRLEQLQTFFQQSILLIASCFEESFPPNALSSLHNKHRGRILADSQALLAFVALMEQSNDLYFVEAFQKHLKETLLQALHHGEDRRTCLMHLGRCWISLGQFIQTLYVPSSPIDPAAVKMCSLIFRNQLAEHLSSQIRLHSEYERLLTGELSNSIIRHMETLLVKIEQPSTSEMALPIRSNVSRLQIFWKEILHFQGHVISTNQIDELIGNLALGGALSHQQEAVVQETIGGFYHRLETLYGCYADITLPIQLSLLHIRLGLRMVQHGSALPVPVEHNSKLVAFPSIHAAALVRQHGINSNVLRAAEVPFLQLSSIALEASIGISVERLIPDIELFYEQMIRLWLIDRAKEAEAIKADSTLYRSKLMEHEVPDDAEIQEQEFLHLFPSFEQAPGSVITKDDRLSSDSSHLHITPPAAEQLLSVHHLLFAEHSALPFHASSVAFEEQQTKILNSIIIEHALFLPDSMDNDSLQYQLSSLAHQLSQLQSTDMSPQRAYNFYSHSNVPQTRRAAHAVEAMKSRLHSLIEDWPEQMVLRHLHDQCDQVLKLDIHSPIAKILSAIEQLLLQTADWEIYANKETSLKAHQHSLTTLVVDWRKLELSCWKELLLAEKREFSNGVSDWWFRMYDAVVRGPLDAIYQCVNGNATNVETYLVSIIPLLDEFLRSSPLGQFHARLELLQSFVRYTGYLASTKTGLERQTQERIQNILLVTWSHFNLHLHKVTHHLSTQQSPLEDEIKKFIKLASWKDVNVLALKQSAVKTHHQLYKVIRKYREVLRQPVEGLLQPAQAAASDFGSDISNDRPVSVHCPPHSIDIPTSSTFRRHLANLAQTYQRFNRYIGDQIRPLIASHSTKAVEAFSNEIIMTSSSLSQEHISGEGIADKRLKAQKALLVRKRKAWSDLLKELKRSGLTFNVKPDVLQRQMDTRWIREQKPISSSQHSDGEKIEMYLHRLLWLLPSLRLSLSDHHSDLTTRELQRGIMFLESAFSITLESRLSLTAALKHSQALHQCYQRLNMVASSPQIVCAGPDLQVALHAREDACSRLGSALHDVTRAIETFNYLQNAKSRIPESFVDQVRSRHSQLPSYCSQLAAVVERVSLTPHPVLLSDERQVIIDIDQHLEDYTHTFKQWCQDQPRLGYVLRPLSNWFDVEYTKTLGCCISDQTKTSASIDYDPLVDSLLLVVQGILAEVPTTSVLGEDRDTYIRDDHSSIRKITELLRLEDISQRLAQITSDLPNAKQSEIRNQLSRMLPFLSAYQSLVEEQLSAHGAWTKAMVKLCYVLCSVLSTLSKQGFCKPPDEEEGDAEGGTETIEGTGFGEGSGGTNVSKEIEEESQVEGLRGEDEPPDGENNQGPDDNDAIEMDQDIGGKLEDVPDDQSEGENEADEDEDADMDEDIGDLDRSDPDVVDEKLWGDEERPEDSGKQDEKTNQDHGQQQSDRKSEMVGKEDDKKRQNKDEEITEIQAEDEEPTPDNQDDVDGDKANAGGAPMDDFVPEADTLDLPDDMNLDLGEEQKDEEDRQIEDEDEVVDEQENDAKMDASDEEQAQQRPEELFADESKASDETPSQDLEPESVKEDTQEEEQEQCSAIAQADIGDGEDTSKQDSLQQYSTKESTSEKQKGAQKGASGVEHVQEQPDETAKNDDADSQGPADAPETTAQDAGKSGGDRSQQGPAPAQQHSILETNPLRNLGDALKEVQKHFDDIFQSRDETFQPKVADTEITSQLEYIHPDDEDQDMQALGAAGEENVAKLHDLHLTEGNSPPDNDDNMPMDIDLDMHTVSPPNHAHQLPADPTSTQDQENRQGAIVSQPSSSFSEQPASLDIRSTKVSEELNSSLDEGIELELRHWQSSGYPDTEAEHIWRLYGSLTHDLSYALCEQLRLILEPTLATRLKGDYRTGKRLNMKKIVSYIASDYTKDKIWLRRTKPSQREYQIFIALDDSRSMAESHSVHLAYETLALVSRALNRLEAGDIAIAKFGKTVNILHGFDDGPFTDQAGSKVISAFRFNQEATNVLSLVETSLKCLELAKERRSSSSAADLWQLEIIISDGICQDHEKLRTALRKAEDQKVMIVFIIVDSLHSASSNVPDSRTSTGGAAVDHSILSMTNAKLKNVDGRLELETERYLDSFPFQYYVILRSVEALPEVLSSTLKQFFERLSLDL